jgi:drug/metabolite transporter (DMT)-like permease
MSRARVGTLLVVGLLAVSVSSVLAAFVIGDTGDGRLGLSIAFWRCAGGAAALAPFALRARRTHPVARTDRQRLLVAGAFLAVHFALFLGSIAYTSVASAATLATMAGVFVAIGGIWYLGEHPSRRTWTGILITMVGALAIGAGDLADISLGPRALFGDAMAFLSSVTVAGYLLIARKVRSRVHATTFATVVYTAAGGVLLVLCLAFGAPLWGFTTGQWLGIIGIIIGPQLLGHNIFTTLLSSVPATVVGVVVLAEPLIATLLAWAFLDQLPAMTYWFAAPVVLVGLFVATVRRPVRQPQAIT